MSREVRSSTMGVSYNIYNLTTQQTVSKANGYWTFGQWQWEPIIQAMNWNKTDEIKAISEEGDVYVYRMDRTDAEWNQWIEQDQDEPEADEYIEIEEYLGPDDDEEEYQRWFNRSKDNKFTHFEYIKLDMD